MNQWKKGFQPTPFQNMENNFQKKYSHSNKHNTQGEGRPINLGTKKFGDNPTESLKCWEHGEPHLRRNSQCLTSTSRSIVHSLQEASTIGDVGISVHGINVALDGPQVDHQSTIVDIEGKVNNNRISILID